MFNFDNLEYYTGTEQYYKNPYFWFVYTDGVKYVCDNGGAWLIQDISLYTYKHKEDDFISVEVVFKNHTATITFSDGNEHIWDKKEVLYTPDFADGEIKLFIYDNVCLLANEY